MLEAKVRETWRGVSSPTEQSKGVKLKKELPKKYRKMSTDEGLDTVKQRLTVLATHLKKYMEARRKNVIFSNQPGKVYSGKVTRLKHIHPRLRQQY